MNNQKDFQNFVPFQVFPVSEAEDDVFVAWIVHVAPVQL